MTAAALCLPFLHMVYWLGDEGVLLDGATRMLDGGRLYKDFFEFLPPGGFILTAGWLKIFGTTLASARVLAIATISGIALFTYLACWIVSGSRAVSVAVPIAWIVMSQGQWTVLNHHWLESLFAIVTVWATLGSLKEEHPSLRWPLIAGIAAGMACMIVETCGAWVMLAALPAFLIPRQRVADTISYIVGCGVFPAAILTYLALNHTLPAAYFDVVQFAAEHYASIQYTPYGMFANVQNLLLQFVFPVAVLLASVLAVWRWGSMREDRLFWQCTAFCIAGFLNCFPRPDIVHIGFAVPLAFPLLALSTIRITSRAGSLSRTVIFATVSILIAPTIAPYLMWTVKASRAPAIATPGGPATFPFSSGMPQIIRQVDSLPAVDGYFYYPYLPLMPFLTGRSQVSQYDVFVPGYTLASQYRRACRSVMRSASWVIIDQTEIDPGYLRRIFPSMRNPRPPETVSFEKVLYLVFRPVTRDGAFELLHRRPGIQTQNLCSAIKG